MDIKKLATEILALHGIENIKSFLGNGGYKIIILCRYLSSMEYGDE